MSRDRRWPKSQVRAKVQSRSAVRRLTPRAADLVRLRLFAGLTVEEASSALGVSRRTAERDWTFARTWLFGHLRPRDEAE